MDRSEMCAETFVQDSITWWVRVGNWTSVQRVIVVKVARQLVRCRCVREILSVMTSFMTMISAVQSAGMRAVNNSLISSAGVFHCSAGVVIFSINLNYLQIHWS